MKKLTTTLILCTALLLCLGVFMQSVCNNQSAYAATADVQGVRGVWHRPNVSGGETTLQGLCSMLDKFCDAGINVVFLETFYHGMTIFKSNLVPYYTGFEAYDYGDYPDYLTAFASEAQKRGIEVHAWVQDFYIGVSDDNYFVRHMPDWLLVAQNGSYRQSEGSQSGGYIFLDPANQQVRQYLLSFYDELLSKVPQVAGLNLDYIRYPVSSNNDDTGFTATAMQQFAQLHGLQPTTDIAQFRNALSEENLQAQWTRFRADIVSQFVQQVFQLICQKHPQKLLSTAVFPDFDATYQSKKQDIASWLEAGWLDIVTPMVYYYEASQVLSAVQTIMEKCDNCFCYTGIYATYHNQSEQQLLEQLRASAQAGADGFVLFDSAKTFFQNNYFSTLQQNFGQPSQWQFVPHNVTAEAIGQILNLFVEQALQEDATRGELLRKEAEEVLQQQSEQQLLSALRRLVNYNLKQYLSETTYANLFPQAQSLLRSVQVRIARDETKQTQTVLPQQPNPDNTNPDGSTPDGSTPDDGTNTDGSATPDDGTANQTPSDNGNQMSTGVWAGVAVCVTVALIATCIPFFKRGKK